MSRSFALVREELPSSLKDVICILRKTFFHLHFRLTFLFKSIQPFRIYSEEERERKICICPRKLIEDIFYLSIVVEEQLDIDVLSKIIISTNI
jgi:hypothetical protein